MNVLPFLRNGDFGFFYLSFLVFKNWSSELSKKNIDEEREGSRISSDRMVHPW